MPDLEETATALDAAETAGQVAGQVGDVAVKALENARTVSPEELAAAQTISGDAGDSLDEAIEEAKP